MTLDRALRVAVRELRLARSALKLEANMYRLYGARYPAASRAHFREQELERAQAEIEQLRAALAAGEVGAAEVGEGP